MLLETIIETKDDPENALPNWEAIIDFLVTSLRNPHEQANIWSTSNLLEKYFS
jgi:hypothetical protein